MGRLTLLGCAFALLLWTSNGQSSEGKEFNEAKNESAALGQFGMVLKTEGVPSFRDEDFVVTKGAVAPQWKSECRQSPKTTDGDQLCAIRTFDEFRDQVTFEFLYSDASLYTFKRPTVSAAGGRAHPQVRDFSNDVDEKTGEITVRHGCSPVSSPAVAISKILLTLPLDDNTKVTLTWDKECGSGQHKKLDYGWFAGSGGDLSKPVSLRGRNNESPPVFGPKALSTRIYMTLEEGAHSQYYDTPEVEATSVTGREPVGVELRGSNFGGVVVGMAYSVFDVMYTCHAKGLSEVTVSVAVRPFSTVRMRWRKDCGGGPATRLNVGTTAPAWGYATIADVVRGGEAVRAFSYSGKGSKLESTATKHRNRMGNRIFYVWAMEGGDAWSGGEEIGEVSAHASDERVVTAGVRMRREVNGIVGTARPVGVWTKCKKRGKTRVRVTMTVRDRDAVEWWFDDECDRVRLRGRKAVWRLTAANVMYGTLGMLAVVMWMWMRRACAGADKRMREPVLRHEWRTLDSIDRIDEFA